MSFCSKTQQLDIIKLISDLFTRRQKRLRGTPSGETLLIDNIRETINLELDMATLWTDDEISETLEKFNFREPLNEGSPEYIKSVISADSGYFSNKDISELFHGSKTSKLIFDGYINKEIVNAFLIGKSGDTFVYSDEALNANFTGLKNELFLDIQKFLMSNGYLKQAQTRSLYSEDGSIEPEIGSYYVEVMRKLNSYISNPNASGYEFFMSKGRKIPNLDGNNNKEAEKAYHKAVLLTNFDTIIAQNYGTLVDINNLYVNDLQNPITIDKYKRNFKPESTVYWSNEAHVDEGVESANVKLSAMIVNSIPARDVKNRPTEDYMELKDLYLLASVIHRFERLNGVALLSHEYSESIMFSDFDLLSRDVSKGFLWYINNIKKALDKNDTNNILWTYFRDYRHIIYSLEHYLNNEELNIKGKEERVDSPLSISTILGQILTNSYGATYTIFNPTTGLEVQELYSQNFNNTSINNTVYSKMVSNSHINSFYDLSDPLEKTRFDNLFKGISDTAQILTIVENNQSNNKGEFYKRLSNYLFDKTGLRMSLNSLKAAITDEIQLSKRSSYTVDEFKKHLIRLINAMNDDFTNSLFKNSLDSYSRKSTDSTIGTFVTKTINTRMFKMLSAGYLEDVPIKSLTNIRKQGGETIPAYKLANMTYKDAELIQQQIYYQNSGQTNLNSLFAGDTPVLMGTSTRLEVTNEKVSSQASLFTPGESFLTNFKFEFFDNIEKNNRFDVIIGAYSDKSTVLTKSINSTNYQTMDINDILDTLQDQGYAFYASAVHNVITTYHDLFRDVLKNSEDYQYNSVLHKAVIDLENVYPKSAGIVPYSSLSEEIVEKYKTIINSVLSIEGIKISDLLSRAHTFKGKITDNLHYSGYLEGIRLNKLVFDNFQIFANDSIFKQFVQQQEGMMIDDYKEVAAEMAHVDEEAGVYEMPLTSAEMYRYGKMLGLNVNTAEFKLNSFSTTKDGKNTMHPLARKWFWLNGLFRNEYLYITTKGEYMHPHGLKNLSYQEGIPLVNRWDNYKLESSYRLGVMSKRNVTNTSTFKVPVEYSKYGVPSEINIAAIEDIKATLYGITEEQSNLAKVHDGSSWMHPVYSRQIDASYPGEGYEGTKKRFGTLIGPNGVTVKKDAEFVISNERIVYSLLSDYKFANMNKKMLSVPINASELNFKKSFKGEFFYAKDGYIYMVDQVHIYTNPQGEHILSKDVTATKNGKHFKQTTESIKISTLFNIYEAIGGPLSTDKDGNLNEGSMDLLYDIVTNTTSNVPGIQGEGVLKNSMIHILSNTTALKAGASNVNSVDSWKDDNPLQFTTEMSNMMGIQLDATHNPDGSTIKEVTQIISALAQGGFTAEIAREAYKDIQNIIKHSASKYKEYLSKSNNDDLYKYIADRFIEAVLRSNGNEVAKSLIQDLKDSNIHIPFSNSNFYNAFVQDIITKMNDDFISRTYTGMGTILTPSHGLVQLFDVEINGEMVPITQKDLIQLALSENVPGTSNEEAIQNILNKYLGNIEVDFSEIELGDNIINSSGEVEKLDTLEKYYNFKNSDKVVNINGEEGTETVTNYKVTKVRNVARDLKPTLLTFYYDSVNEEDGSYRRNYMNSFDISGIKYRAFLEQLAKEYKLSTKLASITKKEHNFEKFVLNSKLPLKYIIGANNLIATVFSGTPTADFSHLLNYLAGGLDKKAVSKFLNNWAQRDLTLLEKGFITNDITDFEDFQKIVDIETLEFSFILNDVFTQYSSEDLLIPIKDVKIKKAEIITGDMYKTAFLRESENIFNILIQGSDYFKNKIIKDFSKDETEADLKLISSDSYRPVYIKYVNDIENILGETVDMYENLEDTDTKFPNSVSRYDAFGNITYSILDRTIMQVKNVGGKEIIYINVQNSSPGHIKFLTNEILRSFGGKLRAVDPLMSEVPTLTTSYWNKNLKQRIDTDFKVNEVALDIFHEFFEVKTNTMPVRHGLFQSDESGNTPISNISEILAIQKMASWKKSRDIIVARIPAQSKQSFMPMNIVSYSDNSKNDAFVSVHQIWLQGSDFDIDKGYVLGHSLNKNGLYQPWSPISTFNSVEQIEALEKLPMPNTSQVTLGDVNIGVNITNEMLSLVDSIAELNFNISDNNLPVEIIEVFNKIIRKIDISDKAFVEDSYYTYKGSDPISVESLATILKYALTVVNSHNKFKPKDTSLRNGVVSKLLRDISAPSNQILANSPISIKEVHDAVATVKGNLQQRFLKEGKEIKAPLLNSPYSPIAYGRLQYNAAVGKDDVGIFANGVKVFYGLSDYYNNFFNVDFENLSNFEKLIKSPNFNKTITFTTSDGTVKTHKANTIADLQISKSVREAMAKISKDGEFHAPKSNAALILSALLSAATDNAKELLMAKINATPDLASVHVYLAIIGMDINDIVEIMTSPAVDEVVKARENNTYIQEYAKKMENIFKDLLSKHASDKEMVKALETFQDLYESAQEITALSGLFGINQKRKANTWEVYKYLTRIETVFKTTNAKYKSEIQYDPEVTKKAILANNPLLNTPEGILYIDSLLERASKVKVTHQDYDGKNYTKTVNIIQDGIDFRYFVSDDNYKQLVNEYYSLIKKTFNVFDIIDTVPHFKEMINSLVLTHETLKKLSVKYNYVTNTLKDVIDLAHVKIDGFNKKYIDTSTINRGIQYLDGVVIENWLRSQSNLAIPMKNLLELADKDSYVLYNSPEALNTLASNPKHSFTVDRNTNYVLKLNSSHNIANFKRIMEDLVLPILQTKANKKFADSFKVEAVQNLFGERGSAIVSSFPLQELNSPMFARRFQQMLNSFDFLDINKSTQGILKNHLNNPLKWRDLFFVYNLIVNNDKYGNKRLTPLFENYMKEEDTLGRDFIKYWSKIESGEIPLFSNVSSEGWRESLETNLLIHIGHDKGYVKIKGTGSEKDQTFSLNNHHFTLISDATMNEDLKTYYKALGNITSLIKDKGLLVELKCK